MKLESVKDILMTRDGMTEDEAWEAIEAFQEEVEDMMHCEESDALEVYGTMTDLFMYHFGLEPDYLDEEFVIRHI